MNSPLHRALQLRAFADPAKPIGVPLCTDRQQNPSIPITKGWPGSVLPKIDHAIPDERIDVTESGYMEAVLLKGTRLSAASS
jgi:hypothetical protein